MGVALTCPCGASLIAPDGTPSIVCARCSRTIAVPQPEATNIGLAETMLQMPPVVRPQASRRWLPLVAIGLAGAAIAIGVAVWKQQGDRVVAPLPPPAPVPPPKPPRPHALLPATPATTTDELLAREHQALAAADPDALAQLVASDAFGFGSDASELAITGKALAAAISHDLGTPPPAGFTITPTYTFVGRDAVGGFEPAWIVEYLDVSDGTAIRHVATSQVATREGPGWVVAAWQFASLLANKRAYDLARAHQLPAPAEITSMTHGEGADAAAGVARVAFASRPAFIATLSDREQAIDVGSAPGEHVTGGAAFQHAFAGMRSELAASGGMRVAALHDAFAWSAQNVDFTLTEKDGTKVTERFRVLALLANENPGGWKIVMTQWSNGGPFP